MVKASNAFIPILPQHKAAHAAADVFNGVLPPTRIAHLGLARSTVMTIHGKIPKDMKQDVRAIDSKGRLQTTNKVLRWCLDYVKVTLPSAIYSEIELRTLQTM